MNFVRQHPSIGAAVPRLVSQIKISIFTQFCHNIPIFILLSEFVDGLCLATQLCVTRTFKKQDQAVTEHSLDCRATSGESHFQKEMSKV